MTTITEKIAIMQAFDEGKPIEYRTKHNGPSRDWCWTPQPAWDWDKKEYRITAIQPKPKKNVYAYLDNYGFLIWHQSAYLPNMQRIPSEDKKIEL